MVPPLKPKLSSETRTGEREPSGGTGPQVMPSTLSASAVEVVKSKSSFFRMGVSVPDRACSPLTSVAPCHSSANRTVDSGASWPLLLKWVVAMSARGPLSATASAICSGKK